MFGILPKSGRHLEIPAALRTEAEITPKCLDLCKGVTSSKPSKLDHKLQGDK